MNRGGADLPKYTALKVAKGTFGLFIFFGLSENAFCFGICQKGSLAPRICRSHEILPIFRYFLSQFL